MTMLPTPVLQTTLGRLYEGDCLEILADIETESVDLAFADPPFNLNKEYSSGIDDNLAASRYLEWCRRWALEMARTVKSGGSLFLYNCGHEILPADSQTPVPLELLTTLLR